MNESLLAPPQQSLDHDSAERIRALNPTQSFIIQAPAGSGKTELLIQRYLVLLTRVAKPEHVLAVTFTKKACGEMRARIFQALEQSQGPEPALPHTKKTWQLSRAVYAHAHRCGWPLATIAQKLSIYTIDAMCQQFLSLAHPRYQVWTTYQLALQPDVLYEETVQQFMHACSQEDHPCCDSFYQLLRYHQLDTGYCQRLFVSLLQTREQWLPHVVRSRCDQELIPRMEATIVSLQNHSLQRLISALSSHSCDHFLEVYHCHAALLREADVLSGMPDIDPAATINTLCIADWVALSDWLLTKQGTLRSRFTSAQGILAKKALQDLPESLRSNLQSSQQALLTVLAQQRERPDIAEAWRTIQGIPLVYKDASHWEPLQTLLALLPYLAAFLTMHMQNNRTSDFAQITVEVLAALHDEQTTPPLRELLFQHVQHLLVDECQDISLSQHQIFSMLVSEWSGDPNRSVTMVGDPMQSIYRFRQADVRLFGVIQEHGLGGLPLTPLNLEKNYRSQALLVEWVNHCFRHIEDSGPHTVAAYPAIATRPALSEAVHWHFCQDAAHEGTVLATVVRQLQTKDPQASIGILVRARSQLKNIMPVLRSQSIDCRAVGIDSLATKQSLLDCITLVLLPDLSDRLHWTALLRCPFAYVSWADITLLAQSKHDTLWASMSSPPVALTAEAAQTLARIRPILSEYLRFSHRVQRGTLAKKIWHALGGPYTLKSSEDYCHIESFFDAVNTLEEASTSPITQTMLTNLLAQTPVIESSTAENPVEVMTVHKSKGLEFDYVLCPALYHGGAPSRKPLLDWMHTCHQKEPELLMHAPPKNQSDGNSIHRYLRNFDSACDQQEQIRLCYVALTRAKKGLHCFSLALGEQAPPAKSWHARLLPSLTAPHPSMQSTTHTTPHADLPKQQPGTPLALPCNWQPPAEKHYPDLDFTLYPDASQQRYQPMPLAKRQDLIWGEIVHRFLQWVGHQGLSKVHQGMTALCAIAHELGIPDAKNHTTLHWVFSRLCGLQSDPQAQWLFSPSHQAIFVEKTMFSSPEQARYRCDLRFLSAGHCWIIDFKTAGVETRSACLPHPAAYYRDKYHEQLARYRKIATAIEPNCPVKTGLFFPLQGIWIELS